jgi:DNA-binding transcriptional LysR family regulator
MLFDVVLCSAVMNIELRHLRALAAIGDEGSITAAAAVLHVTQPALSRTLSQLEDRIGTQLVDRTTRSLELTPAGKVLWEKAHRILQSVEDAITEAAVGPAPLRAGYTWSALGRHTVRAPSDVERTKPGNLAHGAAGR